MRVMNNNKTFFESFQENLNESEKLLEPQYDSRKSFYGKAKVDDENGVKTLTSYKTPIMKIENGEITMLCGPEALTQTTLRHIREFLQQNGLEPLTKRELLKLTNKNKINEQDESYSDLEDREIVNDVIENYKEITGEDLESIFNYKEDEYEGGLFKQDVIDNASQAVVDYLEGKGLSRSRVDDLLYALDDKLSELWNNYVPDDLNEQDETVKVVTANQKERNYSITDITELSNVNDGDVQAPIDIAGLLVEVDERLTESVGEDWGQINFQSTRFNADTKDSNALFELCVGDKTYLMSMLLEENCSLLKVNNTKGKTIFKRKTNDIVGIAESYIRQFIPVNESAKEEKEDLFEKILSENTSLSDKLVFIKLSMEGLKSVDKEDKESLKAYIQKEVYAFVTELGTEVKNNVPNDDDTTELPTFDKMVEELFGKEWVKEEKEPEATEVSGSETLTESNKTEKEYRIIDTKTNKVLKTFKADEEEKGYNEMRKMGEELKKSGKEDNLIYKEFTVKLKESAEFYYKEFSGAGEIDYVEFETEQEACDYAEKVNKDTGHETAVYRIDNDECVSLYDALNEAEEPETKEEPVVDEPGEEKVEQPKQGLGTGNAEFFRKPKDINDLNDKSGKGFTDGDSSYLIVSKETLSKDEFDKLQDDFGATNSYCKSFDPIDSDSYAFNVIEFSCNDYDYKLLVDPSGYDYCRYVAKVGGYNNEIE